MKKTIYSILILTFFGFGIIKTNAQPYSATSNFVAQPIPDRSVIYNVTDEGVSKPITWGLDLAWLDEVNIIRGARFMDKSNVDVIRSSFMPTDPLVNGTDLQGDALTNTNLRIDIIKRNLGTDPLIVLNSDHPSVDPYFYGNAPNWANLIDVTRRMHEDQGLSVVTVSPFNEPDYSATGQGTIEDFYAICGELRNNSNFDAIRISGGNTLNPDFALDWYNYLKDRLDEGNTHQLAGTFDNYAAFYEAVRANGHHATNDELHNVMEAIVGSEYGLQTSIWWGTAEYARGELCKATDGVRLGYAEHRPNWTAAAVYRAPDGKVQAFGGVSERQAVTTTFRYFSKDRDVYYDGHGPQREFVLEMPGGTGYEQDQSNAERVINITWGDDIQPVIDGRYILVNRASGKVMEAANGGISNGTNIWQASNTGATYQQWNVVPIDSRSGGDFSYFNIIGVSSGKHIDINNFSLDNGGNAQIWQEGTNWDGRQSLNQLWYLEYAGDGWFFIRNVNSTYTLEVVNGSYAAGANIQQYEKRGGNAQQWRFLPVDAPVEFIAPSVPGDLTATANAESILLEWTASPEEDVAGYSIFRSETTGGPYNTIARNVTSTSFLDNSATIGIQYYYVIKAVDYSLNSSEYSVEVASNSTNNPALIAYYPFDNNLSDSSINMNHADFQGNIGYETGKVGTQAITLNGTDAFVQLPTAVPWQDEITISTWVYWQGGSPWQRIFDFGNGESEYMFLTTSSGLVGGKLRFAIKNGGEEETLNASLLPFNEWSHVAITLNGNEARMYVNGELADESDLFTISPVDFKPALNYIGRSQFLQDPLFKGHIDDFVMYNYALSADEIAEVYSSGVFIPTNVENIKENLSRLSLWPVPAKDILYIEYSAETSNLSELFIYDMKGKLVMNKEIKSGAVHELNISSLSGGTYILRLNDNEKSIAKKFMVN